MAPMLDRTLDHVVPAQVDFRSAVERLRAIALSEREQSSPSLVGPLCIAVGLFVLWGAWATTLAGAALGFALGAAVGSIIPMVWTYSNAVRRSKKQDVNAPAPDPPMEVGALLEALAPHVRVETAARFEAAQAVERALIMLQKEKQRLLRGEDALQKDERGGVAEDAAALQRTER